MNISNYSKASVLAALYNASKAQGMGFLNPMHMNRMSNDDAQKMLDDGQVYFDYVHGRVLKIDLSTDVLDTRLYNRDLGDGAAERAIKELDYHTIGVYSGSALNSRDKTEDSVTPFVAGVVVGEMLSNDSSPSYDISTVDDSPKFDGFGGGDFGGGGSSDSWGSGSDSGSSYDSGSSDSGSSYDSGSSSSDY